MSERFYRPRSRSRSTSRSRIRRPSLGSRKSSTKSVITIKNQSFNYSDDDSTNASEAASGGNASLLDNDDHLSDLEDVEIPSINANLDHTLPVDYFKQDVLSIVQQLRIPKWHKLSHEISDQIQVTRLSGALTNAIYKVDPPSSIESNIPPSLLLRIYGANVESLIDRSYELRILVRLSKQNIGPNLYGCFNNGRIEQYLDNAITLTRDDIRNKKTSARIARRMRELHDGIRLSRHEKSFGPTVWNNITKWLNKIDDMVNSGLVLDENEVFNTSLKQFKENVQIYKDWLFNQYDENLNNELVFCHNDTQYGNLLFTSKNLPTTSSIITDLSNLSLENLKEIKPSIKEQKQDSNLVVIDFEYSGPNVRAYDLANHFCEWMHNYHDPEFSYKVTESNFPTIDEQLNLIYSYILFRDETSDVSKLEKDAKLLYNDCIKWRAAVNISWGLWAIIQNGENTLPKSDTIIEKGPLGEEYKIIDETEIDESEADSPSESAAMEDDADTFEYLKYAADKFNLVWGDLIQLGLIKEDALNNKETVKRLSADYLT